MAMTSKALSPNSGEKCPHVATSDKTSPGSPLSLVVPIKSATRNSGQSTDKRSDSGRDDYMPPSSRTPHGLPEK